MKRPITTLLVATVFSATPALAVSYANGYFEVAPPLPAEKTAAPGLLEGSWLKSEAPVVQKIDVEHTTIVVPRRARPARPAVQECYTRSVEQNVRGGSVRICDSIKRSEMRTASRASTEDLTQFTRL